MATTPKQMIRLSDGEVMPYSRTLVAANPGKFVEARWNRESKKFEPVGDRPLVEVPKPPAEAEVVSMDDIDDADEPKKEKEPVADEPKAEDYADPTPEIDGAEEAEEPQSLPAKKRKRALPKA